MSHPDASSKQVPKECCYYGCDYNYHVYLCNLTYKHLSVVRSMTDKCLLD